MRILFLTDNFPPEVNAPARRTYEHCREWVKKGIDVTVVTGNPNFPRGRLFPGYQNKWKSTEEIDGIKVIRVWTYISANKGFIKRVVDHISFAITAILAGVWVKTDVIIATTPQFFTTLAGRILSFVKNRPWLMEVRDLWPESISAVGMMKKDSGIYHILEKLEYSNYRSANGIVPVTHAFKQTMIERGIASNKIHVVPNGVDLGEFYPRPKNVDLVRDLNLSEKIVVGYIGTHGMAHGLEFIVKSIALADSTKFDFIFVGDGALKVDLIKLAKKLNLTNLKFIPTVTREEIASYLSVIDVALINLRKSDTFKSVIPSKIFENCAMGKPILLGVEGEAAQIINQFKAGLCYKPEDQSSFLQALDQIVDHKSYSAFQEGCLHLANAYNRSTLADKMLEFVKTVEEDD